MTDWPVEKMRRMREAGASLSAIGRAFECSHGVVQRALDEPKGPARGPIKRLTETTPPAFSRETPQQRAFRRYPITAHKPFFG